MRNLKKVLSTIMAVAMMMSLVVFNTSAAFNDQDKIVNTDAVNMNVSLGIIKGLPDGSFNPTGNVTRAEMAKMICIVLNGGKDPVVGAKGGAATFTDIRGHWAEGYIEYCAASGIVSGMGDGTFAPNANVTATQAAKMLLVALGYDAAFEGFNGNNWNVKINVAASQKDLYEDVVVSSVNNPLSRDNAAQMVWNALNATAVKYTYSLTTVNGALQNVQVREDKTGDPTPTLLYNNFKSLEFEGQLVGFSYVDKDKKWTYEIDPTTGANKSFTSKVDFTGLFGQNVNVVYKTTTDVYGMYAEECTVLFSGIMNDLTVNADSVKIDGTTYDLDSGSKTDTAIYNFTYGIDADPAMTDAYVNDLDEMGTDPVGVTDYRAQLTYSFAAIDYDDDGEVNFFIVYPYTVEQVTYVGSKNITTSGIGNTFVIEDTDVYTGIAKDDYTKITAKANTATNTASLEEVANLISGKVTATKNSGADVYIDGTAYTRAVSAPALAVGDKVKDVVVVNGFIFDADATAAVAATDYALVVDTTDELGLAGAQAKLLFTDGTKKIVDTDVFYDTFDHDGNAGTPAISYVGQLVTFDINSDDEYELTAAINDQDNNDNKESGFKTVTTAGVDTNTTKVKYIGNNTIADSAIIFVDEDGSYKVITGASLKTNASDSITNVVAYANSNSSTGYGEVQMAYVQTDDLVSADTLYGYIVADPMMVENADGDAVYQLSIWNGTKVVNVITKDVSSIQTEAATALEGTVVTYSVNADSEIDTLTVTEVDASTTAAIVAYDGTYVTKAGADTTRYEITDDTVILYVNADKIEGVADGAIQLATEKAVADTYYNNVVMFAVNDADDEIDLLVIDTNNDILNAQ